MNFAFRIELFLFQEVFRVLKLKTVDSRLFLPTQSSLENIDWIDKRLPQPAITIVYRKQTTIKSTMTLSLQIPRNPPNHIVF